MVVPPPSYVAPSQPAPMQAMPQPIITAPPAPAAAPAPSPAPYPASSPTAPVVDKVEVVGAGGAQVVYQTLPAEVQVPLPVDDVMAAQLSAKAPVTTAAAPQQRDCPSCSKKNKPNAGFCVYCGEALTSLAATVQSAVVTTTPASPAVIAPPLPPQPAASSTPTPAAGA